MIDRFRPNPERFRPDPARFSTAGRGFGKRPQAVPGERERIFSPRGRQAPASQTSSPPAPLRDRTGTPGQAVVLSDSRRSDMAGRHSAAEGRGREFIPPPAPLAPFEASALRPIRHGREPRPLDPHTYLGTFSQGMFDTSRLDDRQIPLWNAIMHGSGLLLFAVPWLNVAAAFLMWRKKRSDSRAIDHHGRESLNFQLNVMVYLFIAGSLFKAPELYPVIKLYAAVMALRMAFRAASRDSEAAYPGIVRVVN